MNFLPSGQQAIFDNRVGWARTYIKKAGLIEPTRRGFFRITDRGLQVLKQEPAKIDIKFRKQFEEFKEFRAIRPRKSAGEKESEEEPDTTPEEALASAYQRLRNELADDLLQQLKAGSPTRFENIVVDLLVAKGIMGAEMQYLGLHDWLINQSSGPLPS